MSAKTRFSLAADLLDPPAWQPAGRDLLPRQQPPAGDWTLFLLEGGRGSGKRFACMAYLAAFMGRHPAARGRIIGPHLQRRGGELRGGFPAVFWHWTRRSDDSLRRPAARRSRGRTGRRCCCWARPRRATWTG